MNSLEFCNLPTEELKSVLKSRMNEHRYAHSLMEHKKDMMNRLGKLYIEA